MSIIPPASQKPLAGALSSHRPPVFVARNYSSTDVPQVSCATCPAALWYESESLRCFCTIMKFISYSPSGAAISACDGREVSLADSEPDGSSR